MTLLYIWVRHFVTYDNVIDLRIDDTTDDSQIRAIHSDFFGLQMDPGLSWMVLGGLGGQQDGEGDGDGDANAADTDRDASDINSSTAAAAAAAVDYTSDVSSHVADSPARSPRVPNALPSGDGTEGTGGEGQAEDTTHFDSST